MTATYPPSDAHSAPEPDDLVARAGPRGRIKRAFDMVPPWVPAVAVGGLALTSCVYVAIVDPNTQQSGFYPQCTFKSVTGLDCPGCGLTRAMHSLMTGHPLAAMDHNIFIMLIFPLAAYMYVRWLLRVTVGYELPKARIPYKVGYVLAPLVLAFWVVRNIPWGPFAWLGSGAS